MKAFESHVEIEVTPKSTVYIVKGAPSNDTSRRRKVPSGPCTAEVLVRVLGDGAPSSRQVTRSA